MPPGSTRKKKLFSKLEMDDRIPQQWRLSQARLENSDQPSSWPVFLKPEWGQNAKGIFIAKDTQAFDQLRLELLSSKVPYLVQEAAEGHREFEIFFIRQHATGSDLAVLSVTETLNNSNEDWPINSILNTDTRHQQIPLSTEQQQQLQQHLQQLPAFRIARVGLRTDTIEAMIEGEFQIIEINLFVPMPLLLLDNSIPLANHHRFIRNAMLKLARLTLSVPLKQPRKSIFWPMFFLNYRVHS